MAVSIAERASAGRAASADRASSSDTRSVGQFGTVELPREPEQRCIAVLADRGDDVADLPLQVGILA